MFEASYIRLKPVVLSTDGKGWTSQTARPTCTHYHKYGQQGVNFIEYRSNSFGSILSSPTMPCLVPVGILDAFVGPVGLS